MAVASMSTVQLGSALTVPSSASSARWARRGCAWAGPAFSCSSWSGPAAVTSLPRTCGPAPFSAR
ncbi:hypothetical protein ACFQZC_36170 [Streptacidiphilus monticola]